MLIAGEGPRVSGRVITYLALAVATSIGSMGLAAGGTAGGLLAVTMVGKDAAAGLPLGFLVLGSAMAAAAISRAAGRFGRARSLSAGYIVGMLGAAMVITGVGKFVGLLVGSVLMGAASASVFLTRYAGAAISREDAQGRALGGIFFASAIGAVASPSLLGPTGGIAEAQGLLPALGLYGVAVLAFGSASGILLAASSDRVPFLGMGSRLLGPELRTTADLTAVAASLNRPWPRIALVTLAASNMIMVAAMMFAPVHLRLHGYSLQLIGVVISFHVAGMLAPAPLSGWLADRVGPARVATSGFVLLTFAGVGGAIVHQHSPVAITVVLTILGVGWNFGVVGGSTMLAGSVPGTIRPYIEGIGEVAMGTAAALGAPLAGLIAAIGGFTALSSVGAVVALFALTILVWTSRRRLPALSI